MSLDKVKEWLYRCYRCGNCKQFWQSFTPSCPSGEYFHFESYYPSGRIWIGKALYAKSLNWSPSIAKKVYACTLCGACSSGCQVGIKDHSQEILESLREAAVAVGAGPMPEQKKYACSLSEEHNPYNEPHSRRASWLSSSDTPSQRGKPSVLYFVGCTSSYRRPEIASATVKILDTAGVEFTILDDEWCCGSPLLRTGQVELGRRQAEHNAELINNSGSEILVTSCAGCYRAFLKDYADRLQLKLKPKVLHITQFLDDLLKEGRIETPSRLRELKLTYHDPCHLGRHCGVYDPPRSAMKRAGIELIEMKRTREKAWCCGSGGGVRSAFPDMAIRTGSLRIKEAKQTGCDTLVSACPFCKHNLLDAAEKSGNGIKVIDIVELFT